MTINIQGIESLLGVGMFSSSVNDKRNASEVEQKSHIGSGRTTTIMNK